MSALLNAIRILSCFSEAEPELRLMEISRRMGLSKSHTHRLLATLLEEGLLKRDPKAAKYQLGLRLFQMGRLAVAGFDPPAWPAMQELARITNETVLLGVPDDCEVVFLQQVLSPHTLRVDPGPTWRGPLTRTVTGRAILAWQPEDEIRRVMRHDKIESDEAERFRLGLDEVQERGVALSQPQSRSAIRAVAAPLFNENGVATGALTVAAPAQRLASAQVPHLAQLVMRTAKELSGQLGHWELSAAARRERIR